MGCCDYVRFALDSEHDKTVDVRWQRASIDVSFVWSEAAPATPTRSQTCPASRD
jgi:hypothetical protein